MAVTGGQEDTSKGTLFQWSDDDKVIWSGFTSVDSGCQHLFDGWLSSKRTGELINVRNQRQKKFVYGIIWALAPRYHYHPEEWGTNITQRTEVPPLPRGPRNQHYPEDRGTNITQRSEVRMGITRTEASSATSLRYSHPPPRYHCPQVHGSNISWTEVTPPLGLRNHHYSLHPNSTLFTSVITKWLNAPSYWQLLIHLLTLEKCLN